MLVGKLPFTDISMSPLTTLLLWLIVIPLVIYSRKSISNLFWKIVETIGDLDQARLRRNQRAQNTATAKSLSANDELATLIGLALVHQAKVKKVKSTNTTNTAAPVNQAVAAS